MNSINKFSVPSQDEYNEYYKPYISLFDPQEFLVEFRQQPQQLAALVGGLSEKEVSRLHEPYTWSLKQVVGHIIDCERIFSTRALRIGVGDETPIPGINQNIYVENLNYDSVEMKELLEEFRLLRAANALFAERLGIENLRRMGIASDNKISAKANLFILAGHFLYHYKIMAKRVNGEQ
jgi:hypothetical protein